MKKQTGRFMATGDDNNKYIINIYTNNLDNGDFQNPNAVMEGLKELRTSNGMRVNRLEKGKYQIVQTGIMLLSDSPDAF